MVLQTTRPGLAMRHGADRRRAPSTRNQSVPDRQRAALSEAKVVLLRAPLVGVPLHENPARCHSLEPRNIGFQRAQPIGANPSTVKIEAHIFQLSKVHKLLYRYLQHRATRRRRRQIQRPSYRHEQHKAPSSHGRSAKPITHRPSSRTYSLGFDLLTTVDAHRVPTGHLRAKFQIPSLHRPGQATRYRKNCSGSAWARGLISTSGASGHLPYPP